MVLGWDLVHLVVEDLRFVASDGLAGGSRADVVSRRHVTKMWNSSVAPMPVDQPESRGLVPGFSPVGRGKRLARRRRSSARLLKCRSRPSSGQHRPVGGGSGREHAHACARRRPRGAPPGTGARPGPPARTNPEGEHREHAEAEREGERRRSGEYVALVAGQRIAEERVSGGEHVAVEVDAPLGSSRGPGCESDQDRVVDRRRHGLALRALSGRERVDLAERDGPLELRRALEGAVHLFHESVVAERELDARLVRDHRQLTAAQEWHRRHDDATGARDRHPARDHRWGCWEPGGARGPQGPVPDPLRAPPRYGSTDPEAPRR